MGVTIVTAFDDGVTVGNQDSVLVGNDASWVKDLGVMLGVYQGEVYRVVLGVQQVVVGVIGIGNMWVMTMMKMRVTHMLAAWATGRLTVEESCLVPNRLGFWMKLGVTVTIRVMVTIRGRVGGCLGLPNRMKFY